MNIYAKKGAKVRYTGEGGYDGDKEQSDKHLTVGEVYTVENTSVGGWSTSVLLQEVEKERFNSVHFEDVKGQPL